MFLVQFVSHIIVITGWPTDEGLHLNGLVIMMLLDMLLWGFLAFFADKVLPQEYGTQLPWNFLCSRKYWSTGDAQEGLFALVELEDAQVLAEQIEDAIIEELPVEARAMDALRVQHLRKEFTVAGELEPVIAVHDLTMTMIQDQITALLGHNGAGKTTAISMLTGLIQPTNGGATYKGLCTSDMDGFRQSIGFCPQHDVLQNELTVEEHLILFSGIKGTPQETRQAEADIWIDRLQLAEFRTKRVDQLSGGWKRRLCLGMALTAGSELVFLDEPTSGMDPEARHQTWDMLQAEKCGKVVILTTHFMDEADVLGDRIAIMAAGRLKVLGTSLFLKEHFGLGYTLTTTTCASEEDQGESCKDQVSACVAGHVDGQKPLSLAATELSFQLPTAESCKFPALLRALDELKGSVIDDYGLSSTTLEEVIASPFASS